ncbi:MAG: hypothetical protein ACKOPT_09205 [Cyanobium sp.]
MIPEDFRHLSARLCQVAGLVRSNRQECANHDWLDIFPQKAGRAPDLHYPDKVSAAAFDRITDHITERYFSRENYFRMDGLPFFSIYHLDTLTEDVCGV